MATKKAMKFREDAHRQALEGGILQTLAAQKKILASQKRLEMLVKGLIKAIETRPEEAKDEHKPK